MRPLGRQWRHVRAAFVFASAFVIAACGESDAVICELLGAGRVSSQSRTCRSQPRFPPHTDDSQHATAADQRRARSNFTRYREGHHDDRNAR